MEGCVCVCMCESEKKSHRKITIKKNTKISHTKKTGLLKTLLRSIKWVKELQSVSLIYHRGGSSTSKEKMIQHYISSHKILWLARQHRTTPKFTWKWTMPLLFRQPLDSCLTGLYVFSEILADIQRWKIKGHSQTQTVSPGRGRGLQMGTHTLTDIETQW